MVNEILEGIPEHGGKEMKTGQSHGVLLVIILCDR